MKFLQKQQRGIILGFIAISLLSLISCASKPPVVATNTEQPAIESESGEINNLETKPSIAKKVEAVETRALTPDFVYKYLAGEVSGQRGYFGQASAIFYELAESEQDDRLAQRAAKIAAYGQVGNMLYKSVELWSALDPNSAEANQAMTELLISTNQLSEAEPHLAKLLTNEATRPSVFMFLNNFLIKTSDKDGALALVQSLAKPYPSLSEAQFAIAQAAIHAKKNAVAIDALDKANRLNPGWNVAALLKGQLLLNESPDAAIDFYESFLTQYPNNNEIRLNFAKILVNEGQYVRAKQEFPIVIMQARQAVADADNANKNGVQKSPAQKKAEKNLADMTAAIGLLSYQGEDYDATNSYLQQALDFNFSDPDQIYIYFGEVAEKQGQQKLARDWYEKVTAKQHFLTAQLHIAELIKQTQSVNQAIEFLDDVDHLTTEEQIIVVQTQASMLNDAKRYQDAFKLFEQAVNNFPNVPALQYDFALSAERIKKFNVMEAQLREVIKNKPDFAPAYNALGYSFADRSIKLDEALSLIQKALLISPNDHYMLDSLGWVYYKKGMLNEALNYLDKAYKIHPDPEIAAHLGEVLWKKGLHKEAKQIWDEAINEHPENEVLKATMHKFKS